MNHKNRYWEIGQKEDGTLVGKLYLIDNNSKRLLLNFWQDKENRSYYYYESKEFNCEEFITVNSLREAKEKFEEYVMLWIALEIDHWEIMKEQFNEEETE